MARNRCFPPCPRPSSPCTWFRFWVLSSAFGNLVWYLIASLLSVAVVYLFKHSLSQYVPVAETGVDFLARIATKDNVNLAYALAMLQLSLNLFVSMSYRFRIVQALARISATCMPGFMDVAPTLRIAMAHRAVDTVFWVRYHREIQRVYNRFETEARKYRTSDRNSERFENLRAQVNLAIQLYYNPLSIRMFVHSVFTVSVLMLFKACHNFKSDGIAALPATLFVGLFFAGVLLFIRIADNPFFDDGSGPRLHAHNRRAVDQRVHPTPTSSRYRRQEASVGSDANWMHSTSFEVGPTRSSLGSIQLRMESPDSN